MSQRVALYFRSLFDGVSPVLDLGSGKGDFLWDGAVGVDLDVSGLVGSGHRVVQADAHARLPFVDGAFAGVLAKDIIEHVASPRDVLQEVRRIARPGAVLVVTTPRAVPRAVWADYTHVRGFTRGAIHNLMRDTGWDLVKLSRMGGVPLAGRLDAVRHTPKILAIPGIGHYFGTNWLAIARRG
ncbi:MAG: class I SAM-dependent methyltransferase [Actinomycetota bacterium]